MALAALGKGTVLVAWWGDFAVLCKKFSGKKCDDPSGYDQVHVMEVENGKVTSQKRATPWRAPTPRAPGAATRSMRRWSSG